MAQRIFKQPQPGRRSDEPELPDSGIVTPSGRSYQRPSSSSPAPDKTLSNIDKVLAESEGVRKAGVPASDLRDREKSAGGATSSEADTAERDQVGKGYSGAPVARHDSRFKAAIGKFGKLSTRRKAMLIAGAATGLAGAGGGIMGIFGLLNVFQLDHLLNNIESKGFVRYQVDMEGRSNRWISAYLMLRLAEVESDLKPADRDNLIFRADSIDKTNPLYGWYKILRGSKFEEELFQKHGIKFASIACRGSIVGGECKPGGNVVRFRPAVITIKEGTVPNFNPTKDEIDALQRGDINGFNNRLRAFVDVHVLSNDAQARRAIARSIKANTKGYQVIKRYYLRKAIQNMTGVRDWRFFETKRLPCIYSPTQRQTRDECAELGKSIRNKIIAKAFPESMTGGKFIQCIFGLTSCKTTTDPSNPENKSGLAPLPEDCGASTNPECKTNLVDENGNPVNKDNEAVDGLKDGVSGGTDGGDSTSSITRKITLKILSKLNGPLSIVSIIDQLNIIDKNIKNGSLSSMVYMARATQAIGVFTTFGIMRDQIRTGDVQAEEVNAAMEVINNAGNSEGWQTVVASGDSTVASAASIETTNNKKKYCSAEFQEQMLLEKNREVARSQYHWLCPGEKIGGDNLAKDIENGWNSTVGFVLSPILAAYNASGLATVVGWVNGALDTLFKHTITPLMEGILSAVGLKTAIEDMMAWLTNKVASILGAGPAMSEQAPAGVWANHALMGASAAAEFAARNQGAAVTSQSTAKEATKRVADYQAAEQASMSAYDKYLSLSNPKSAAAQGLFAITDGGIRKTFTATLGSIFSGAIFAPKTTAATGAAYAAANFAGLETYDFPASCSSGTMPANIQKLDLHSLDGNDPRRNYDPITMTPFSATNAEDLGLIPKEEINWELLGNADRFYERLYQDENADGEKIKKVYNCVLLDSSIRGSFSAYDDDLLDENAYGYGFSSEGLTTEGGVGDIPTGTAQELAQRLLGHPNVDFQTPAREEEMQYIARTGHGRDCGAPAVSPTLLGVLLALAEKYKIVLGVVVDNHVCNGGFHPKGMAIDINGVNPLSGGGGTGNHVRWTQGEMGILKKFYDDVIPLLGQVGGGGLGQESCFTGPKPQVVPGVSLFDDTCNHIHMDIGKR